MPRKQKKYHFIYRTTNLINDKFYVGMHSTDDLEDGYFGSGKIVNYSVNKYGIENHKVEILEFRDSREELKKREAEIVNEELLSNPRCMNLKFGGEGGWDHQNMNSEIQHQKGIRGNTTMKNRHKLNDEWSQMIRAQISKRNKDQWQNGFRIPASEEHMLKMTALAQSDEAKAKRIETFKKNGQLQGEKNPMHGKCWVFNRSLRENKVIQKDELENYLASGWERGKVFTKWEIAPDKVSKHKILVEKILNSNVDVTIKGWPLEMSIELGVSRNHVKRVIKKYLPSLWEICFIEVGKRRS